MNTAANQIALCSILIRNCVLNSFPFQVTNAMPSYTNHFTATGDDQMQCNYCAAKVKYKNSHLHSSNLPTHITALHRDKLTPEEKQKLPKIEDFFTTSRSELPTLTQLDMQAIASCCSQHVLPVSIVGDKFFQWAYNCRIKDRHKISQRLLS